MIQNLSRTCDMCHAEIKAGEYHQRNSSRLGPEIMMILAENEGRELKLIELPDGSISMDTCVGCYARMGLTQSLMLN